MQKVQSAFKYTLLIVFTFLFLLIIWPFLPAIVFAIIFAIVFTPMFNFFSVKQNWNKSLSAIIVLLLTVIFILTPILLLMGLITKETIYFVQTFDQQGFINFIMNHSVIEIFNYKLDLTLYAAGFVDLLRNAGQIIGQNILAVGGNILRMLFLFFVFLFTYFFFLRDGNILVKKCRGLLPFTHKQNKELFEKFYNTSKTVFIGYLIAALLSGIAAYVAFTLFGIPGAVIWGLLAGLLSLVPTVGTVVVYLIGTIIAGITFGILGVLGFVVYYIVVEAIGLQAILRPKMVDEKISMHPILVFFSLIGGISAFGSIGIIYGPLIMVMFVSIFDFIVGTKHAIK
jgi:predicted PurR-regulated permease PerM